MKRKIKSKSEQPYLDRMHSIGYLSRINLRAFERALLKHTSERGMTVGQWRFLRVLWEGDNITQRELSERAGTREATTVRTVNSLVKSGFVTRRPSKRDKRKQYIVLTRRAKLLRNKLIPLVVEVNEYALKGVSKADIETTRRVLTTTCTNLGEYLEKLNGKAV